MKNRNSVKPNETISRIKMKQSLSIEGLYDKNFRSVEVAPALSFHNPCCHPGSMRSRVIRDLLSNYIPQWKLCAILRALQVQSPWILLDTVLPRSSKPLTAADRSCARKHTMLHLHTSLHCCHEHNTIKICTSGAESGNDMGLKQVISIATVFHAISIYSIS